jgi:hypothetical protein
VGEGEEEGEGEGGLAEADRPGWGEEGEEGEGEVAGAGKLGCGEEGEVVWSAVWVGAEEGDELGGAGLDWAALVPELG